MLLWGKFNITTLQFMVLTVGFAPASFVQRPEDVQDLLDLFAGM